MRMIIANEKVREWLDIMYNRFAVDGYSAIDYEHHTFKIRLYTNNTLMIQGSEEENIFDQILEVSGEDNYIGCDEVGVGDFFGPSVFVTVRMNDDVKKLIKDNNIPIRDSKKIKDEEIMRIYDVLQDKVEFQSTIIYDKDTDKSMNSVRQKVYYHRQNVLKFKDYDQVVIDLFTTPGSFYEHSLYLGFIWKKEIIEFKADSNYLCVALASILARAIFLKEMNKLKKKYDLNFNYGSVHVHEQAREFIKRYSKEELGEFCKVSFVTYKDL